ncbi:MAG: serine hydrolase [Clostridiales bacterium]|nr:serine hydrolase [Clostridiales bacterium]
MDFEAFVRDITEHGWNVFGTEVYENGLLTHSFGDVTGIHELQSATKTVLSVAAGIAFDDGLFDLNRPVIDYLPEDKIASLSDNNRKAYETIPVSRLMCMSVPGLPFQPEGDSWLDFALSREVTAPDKREFNYSNISAYLTGVCLTNAIGRDLGSFIEERLFRPLEIRDFSYERCPEGYFYGASRMKLSVHDLSKIGLVLYNGGTYEGSGIVSGQYVDLATGIQQMNREGGYGYFIWKYRDGFSINGKWKQKCYVLPKRGIMVTYLSHIEDDSHDLLISMEKHILGISEK